MEHLSFLELAKILISFAICAPSGHNSQPWTFQITENQIIISPDFNKRLEVVDGSNRELFISLGCALQNLQTAATHYGYNSDYVYKEGKIYVNFYQQDNCEEDTLFNAIKQRHTHRGEFTGGIIPDELLQNIKTEENTNVLVVKAGEPSAEIICAKISEGNTIQMSDTAFKRELISWMRFNKKHIEETHNGLCYNVLGFPATPKPLGKKIVGMFLNPKAQNKTDDGVNASASHFAVFSVKENTEENWIALGKTLETFLLRITAEGLAYSFSNQPCEIPQLNAETKSQLNMEYYPSVIIRLGYGAAPKHLAPRENVF
ncbi:MAG: nitroreductase [Bacteroidales bacterium]|nr:nitroreductase [Bacteroidales bacterium]